MLAWLKRPRCHGWTVAQALARQQTTRQRAIRQRMAVPTALRVQLRQVLPSARRLPIALALLCAACVGNGVGVPAPPEAGTVPTTWPQIQAQILGPMCAQPCHHGGAAPKGLALDDAGALQNLVGVASAELPGMQRVAPGQPDESYLIVKVSATDARRVGARMPRTGPPYLTSGQIAALRKWISAGATTTWDANAIDAGSTMMPGADSGAVDAQEEP